VRWLVTGAGGMLGTDLVSALGDRQVTALTREDLDVTDAGAVAAAVAGHDVVVNAAAWTAVSRGPGAGAGAGQRGDDVGQLGADLGGHLLHPAAVLAAAAVEHDRQPGVLGGRADAGRVAQLPEHLLGERGHGLVGAHPVDLAADLVAGVGHRLDGDRQRRDVGPLRQGLQEPGPGADHRVDRGRVDQGVAVGVRAGMYYLIAQAAATLVALFVTYEINRRWSFARSAPR